MSSVYSRKLIVSGSATVSSLALMLAVTQASFGQTANIETAAGTPSTVRLDTITIDGENAWGPVDGYVANRSATASKTDTPLLETPASVSVISRQQMEDQGAQSVSDAVSTTPGVVANWAGYDPRYDYMYIRGFTPTSFLNGLILPTGNTSGSHGVPQIEPYGLERVEVLRGAASALYGQVAPGGILNLVSKRPTATPQREIQVQAGSRNRAQLGFDVSGPANEDGSLLYRLVGVGRVMDLQVDELDDQRIYIAPSFTWQPSEDTSFTFLSSYQKVDSNSLGFYPSVGTLLPGVNGQISSDTYLGEKGFGGFEREFGTIGYEFEHKFSDAVTFRQNVHYVVTDTSATGITARGWQGTSQQLLTRQANSISNDGTTFAIDNQVDAQVATGPLNHELLFGVDYQNFDNDFWYQTGLNSPAAINPLNPVHTAYTPTGWRTINRSKQTLDQIGIYAQDQIHFDRWLLTLTGRQDFVDLENLNRVSGERTERNDDAFSGRVGLNYLFDGGWSPYISYSTGFQPIVGTDYDGNTFRPSRVEQIEAGLKYQPDALPVFAALSVFDLTRTNITTSDPINQGFQVQTGEGRVRGVELEVKATLFDRLDLTAAYAYSDSEMTKSNDTTSYNGVSIATQGKELPFVPHHQASLWANYAFEGRLEGLTFGAGLRYVGTLYGDNANQLKSPATTFVDLAASYDFGKLNRQLEGLDLRVNVRNLFNEDYVTCTGASACYFGEGRTAFATATFKW